MRAVVLQVTSKVYRVPVEETNGNIYFYVQGDGLIIIDAGIPGKDGLVLESIRSLGFSPSQVKAIVLTHYHLDHSGSANAIRSATGAKIYVHRDDAPILEGLVPPQLPKEAPREAVEAYRWFKPVRPDAILNDGDEVHGLRVIHAPGHTPGSIALYDGEHLFAGDNLNFRDGKVQGPPPLFTADMQRARESVRRLLSLDFRVLLPGHGEPVVGDASARARRDLRGLL
ncbi:MBL fold metallo-hydrolase [Acidilobus sp.]|uniref:MBL fold metallo-hydrolase n=1 Tax=Acidilobus sp. TaxID=1872109 RepID=UPI003D0452C4